MGEKGGNLPKFRSGRDLGNYSVRMLLILIFLFLSLGFFTFMLFILGFVFHNLLRQFMNSLFILPAHLEPLLRKNIFL